jgi:hypothetical protein
MKVKCLVCITESRYLLIIQCMYTDKGEGLKRGNGKTRNLKGHILKGKQPRIKI